MYFPKVYRKSKQNDTRKPNKVFRMWLKHFYNLKAIHIFCVFAQYIVKTA